MDLLLDTLLLRPYVFAFLAAFLAAGAADLGWRRTLLFGAWVWPLAWVAEFSSTRIGVPFGLYHYTGSTRGRELYVADVPFMDSLSFTFLAYAAFCLARTATRRGASPPVRRRSGPGRPLAPASPRPPVAGAEPPVGTWAGRVRVAGLAGFLMMLLDVVIDPLAVRGDRWFLGRLFYYPAGGAYFGVPLSNFAGWWVVGTLGVGGYLALAGRAGGRRPGPGVALYYTVLGFNLVITAWIGEWRLLGAGLAVHAALAAVLMGVSMRRWCTPTAAGPGP